MSSKDPVRARLVVPVALTILGGWAVSLGLAVVAGEYQPLTITTPVMLLLAGYVFGVQITKGPRDDR